MDTDAKCPSFQVSGIMAEWKISPELAVTPLSANEKTVPTTSPVVAFNTSPLRRWRGVSVLQAAIDDIGSEQRARDSPCGFSVEAGPERPCRDHPDGRGKLPCEDGGELGWREGALRGHRCRPGDNLKDGSSDKGEGRGGAHVGL